MTEAGLECYSPKHGTAALDGIARVFLWTSKLVVTAVCAARHGFNSEMLLSWKMLRNGFLESLVVLEAFG